MEGWKVCEALKQRSKIEADRRGQISLAIMAACGIALNSGIIASLVYLLLALGSRYTVRPLGALERF
jgi:hypothetical protein